MESNWCWPRRCGYAARPIVILVAPVAYIVITLMNTGFLVMAAHTNGNPAVIYVGRGGGSGTTYTLTNATGTLFLLAGGITVLEYLAIALLVAILYFSCCCGCRAWCCQRTGGDSTGDEIELDLHNNDINTDAADTVTLEHNQMDSLIFNSDTEPSDDG